MNKTVKLVVYVLLIAAVIGFGYAFSRTYSRADQRTPDDSPTNGRPTIETNVSPSTNVQASATATNAQSSPTTNALPAPVVGVANAQGKTASHMMAYGAVCFAAILGIGLQ